MNVTNTQVRKLREAFRLLYAAIGDDRGQEALDHMRFELESRHKIELYLADLHPDLDPPDDDGEIQPFDAALAAWLGQNDYTSLDWYENGWYENGRIREESEAVLGCKFNDFGRRI